VTGREVLLATEFRRLRAFFAICGAWVMTSTQGTLVITFSHPIALDILSHEHASLVAVCRSIAPPLPSGDGLSISIPTRALESQTAIVLQLQEALWFSWFIDLVGWLQNPIRNTDVTTAPIDACKR
jgi:hypothetical protein